MAAPNNHHAASGQQSHDNPLVYNPGLWPNDIAPRALSNVAAASGGSQHSASHQNDGGVSYQTPNNNINNWHSLPGTNDVAGFANQYHNNNVAGFTGQHHAPIGNWTPAPGQHLPAPGQHFTPPGQYPPSTVRTMAPPPGLGYPINQRPEGYSAANERPQTMRYVDQHQPQPTFVHSGPQPMQTNVQRPQPAGSYNRSANNAVSRPRPANQRAAFPPARVQFQTGQNRDGQPNDGVGLDPNFQFSANYRGSRQSRQNFSANVDDGNNCSLFMRGLPPTCTPNMLLRQIRACGTKVWALHINAPDERNPRHCAAKLVFFQRCGVDWVWDQIEAGTFVVTDARGRDYFPNAVYNNIKSAPMDPANPSSRVVVVVGPASIVIVEALNQFFKANFRFEVDDVYVTHDQDGWRAIEFHFSSTRCQAENAMQELERLQALGPREGPETSAL